MVELRKRKSPPVPGPAMPKEQATAPKRSTKQEESASPAPAKTDSIAEAGDSNSNPTSTKGAPPKADDTIDLSGFGGTVRTNDDKPVTLEQLVAESKAGVVLFTYPKASTPGCTTQACLFRDDFTSLTATGLSIYGLSTDSPKSNTSFKTKRNLPYTLLCDPQATLIGAIGFKKSPKGTQRGVFVVDKDGKVLAVQPGGPAATVDVVRGLLSTAGKQED